METKEQMLEDMAWKDLQLLLGSGIDRTGMGQLVWSSGWISKCGPHAPGSNIIWELTRNAHSQALTQIC